MDIRLFLSKVIMLIFRSRQLSMDGYDTLIHSALENVRINDKEDGFLNAGVSKKLVQLILELLESSDEINLENLMFSLEVILETDPKLLKTIRRTLSKELDELETKAVIGSLASEISSYSKFEKSRKIISQLSYSMNHGNLSIADTFKMVRESMGELEPLTVTGEDENDPGLIDSLFLTGQESDFYELIKASRERLLGGNVYTTGWQDFNDMTQGGLRPGEAIGLGAMQHNYKTGTAQSLFAQIVRLNKPIMRPHLDDGKTPVAVYFYLEDPLENGINFLYQYIKANEGIKISKEELENTTVEEIHTYIKENMERTGFRILFAKVNPSEWGFSELFNYILRLEAKGFTIRVAFIDYLLMLQVTGCRPGQGIAEQDLVNRVSNFFRARQTVFLTPFQLSQDAMNLLRNGTPNSRFIKEIAGKNYSAKSKSISQEFDLELYCHVVPTKDKTYLSLGRGKHRLPTNVEEKDKFFMLPFPDKDTPVLEDIYGDRTGIRKLPRGGMSVGGSGGGGSFLDDVLG